MEKMTNFFKKIASEKIVTIALLVNAAWCAISLLVGVVDWFKYIFDAIDYGYFSAWTAFTMIIGLSVQLIAVAATILIAICMLKKNDTILHFIAILALAGANILMLLGGLSANGFLALLGSLFNIVEIAPWLVIIAFAFMIFLPKALPFLNKVKKYSTLAGMISAAVFLTFAILGVFGSIINVIKYVIDWGTYVMGEMILSIFVSFISIITVTAPLALYAIYLGIKNQEN